MECEYCNKIFKTKGILKNHQQTTKYCLKIRNEKNEKWKCNYCEKNFTSKQTLESHFEKCVNKVIFYEKDLTIKNLNNEIEMLQKFHGNELIQKDKIIKEKDELINKLQEQIKELASLAIEKPSNNNHIINNTSNQNSNKMIDNRTLNMIPLDLNQENLKKTLEEKFTENHLINGQKGVAQFFVDNILVSEDNKYMIKCTDPSRKMFIYLDSEGKVHKDINAFKLTHIISDPVIDISHKLVNELPDKYPNDTDRVDFAMNKFVEIVNIKTDNNEFIKNLIPPLVFKN